jgi:multisubunit Na+/H+ antiporter MnhB subunit
MDESGHGSRVFAEQALLGLIGPFWQVVIGAVVLVVLVLSVGRLARRGRSRMTTALLVTAAVIAGFAVIGVLLEG